MKTLYGSVNRPTKYMASDARGHFGVGQGQRESHDKIRLIEGGSGSRFLQATYLPCESSHVPTREAIMRGLKMPRTTGPEAIGRHKSGRLDLPIQMGHQIIFQFQAMGQCLKVGEFGWAIRVN